MATKVVAKKKAKKGAKKSGAVRGAGGRFAGRVAPNMTQQAEELLDTSGPFAAADVPVKESEGLKFKVSVDAKDLQLLTEQCDRIADVAGRVEAAAKVITDPRDPGEKQLHRRVVWAVYDASGARIRNSSEDLKPSDTFTLDVSRDMIQANVHCDEVR